MDPIVIVLIVVVVLLILALGAAGYVLSKRRQSDRLQERFGPEYERSVTETGDRRAAEAQLAEREKRHSELDVRDLRPEERERYEASWSSIQRGFVDDPVRAVRDADVLVVDIMRTRGYPVDDSDRRTEDMSVEHPEVVQHYREARKVRDAMERGSADTEQQRHAVTSYRKLVVALLGHGTTNGDGAHDRDESRTGDRRDDRSPDDRRTDDRHTDDRRTDDRRGENRRTDDRRTDDRRGENRRTADRRTDIPATEEQNR